MEVVESVKKLIQELIVPELDAIKVERAEIRNSLVSINKRLDNLNVFLAEQHRKNKP